MKINLVWWPMPVIPVLRRLKLELSSLKPARAI
jgi:hypothetical protein